MKIMNKKIIGLLMVSLLLLTIPLVAGASDEQQPFAKKRTFISGVILMPPRPGLGGAYTYFFALSVRAGEIGGEYHIYRFQPVFVKAEYHFHGITFPGFILGWFDGPVGLAG